MIFNSFVLIITGSFMIRGKKNFLPPCHLILGLSLMFKLEDSSVARHLSDRSVRTFDNESQKKYEPDTVSVQSEDVKEAEEEEEVQVNEESDSSDNDEGPNRFPDTHIKIGTLSTQVSTESNIEKSFATTVSIKDEEEGAIIFAAPQQMQRKNRAIQKTKSKQGDGKKKQQQQAQKQPAEKQEKLENPNEKSNASGLKRGQRSKLKKIKEKYKDQDEEEKQMRMEILKSAGNKKNDTKEKETEKDEVTKPQTSAAFKGEKKQQAEKKPAEATADLDAIDEDESPGDGNDTDLLNTLTGLPVEEDELLYALPVVAPYNALHNYK